MLKKLLMVGLAAISLTGLIACDDSPEEKADSANDNIAILNSIDTELKSKGVYVITSIRYSLPSNLTDAELTKVKELLGSFVYRGGIVLDLTADENVIFNDGFKLQIAMDNANRLLEDAKTYETYEAKLLRLTAEEEQRKLREERRRQEEEAANNERLADSKLLSTISDIRRLNGSLMVQGIVIDPKVNIDVQDEANITIIRMLDASSLIKLEKDLALMESKTTSGLTTWEFSRKSPNTKMDLSFFYNRSSKYLAIARARIESLTGNRVSVQPTTSVDRIGTVEAVAPEKINPTILTNP